MVTAIQSHDITRQMVEHVIEALHQGDEDFTGGAKLINGVAPAELTLLRRLQASQLRSGHDKLVSALGQMATELGLVSTAAVGLAEETRGLAEPRSGALLDVLERGIDGALLAFREHRAGESETAAALGQVGATVRESVAVVKELDKIGHTVAMIALNAQVAAEKAGTDGRTVSVLAREIHEVADHIAACTAPVSDTLRGIAAAGSRLTDLGGSDPLGDRFMEELRTLLPQLRASRQALTAELGVLRDDGQRLRAEVQHLLARISSATSVTSRLRELADELDAGTVAVVEGAVSAHETPRLSAAVTRYTMEDERVVHRKIIGADSIGPRSVRPLSPNSDTSLGDNVELF